jgi:hypothetical protein
VRKMLVAALVGALAAIAGLVGTTGAFAADGRQARGAKNTWMTKSIRDRIIRQRDNAVAVATVHRWARAQGKAAPPDEEPEAVCATSDPAEGDVYAGACEVYPYECTANFVYKKGFAERAASQSDGRTYFLGTAGHCVDRANQPMFIQNNGQYVYVGRVDKHMNGGIGNDFGSVQIDAANTIDPSPPAVGGPKEIYTGCDPKGIKFWGHGFGVAVAQGQPGAGLAHLWFDRSFAWAGDGLPGDSGSGVLTEDSQAAGILTHLNIDPAKYPGATHAGTRVTRALTFLGGDYHLVNEDFTLSRATMADTQCGNADSGGGNGATSLVSSLLR